MKKTILIIATLALLFSQCKKADVNQYVNTDPDVPQGEQVYVSLSANKGDGSKLSISAAGIVTWTSGDRLLIVSPTSGVLGTVSLTAGAGTGSGVFGGYVSSWSNNENLKVYYLGQGATYPSAGSSSYTLNVSNQSAGTLADIASKFYVMSGTTTHPMAPGTTGFGTVTLTPITSIAKFDTYTATNFSTGSAVYCKNAWNTATLNLKTGAFSSHTTGDITLPAPARTVYMALIPGTTNLTFNQGSYNFAMNKTIAAGKFYTAANDNEINVVITGGLPGEFSVASGRKVIFSKGNLYYNGSTWNFENNQYDFRTHDYGSCIDGVLNTSGGTPSGHWGWFAWSTNGSGSNWGMYSDGAVTGSFVDWGQNSISNGCNTANIWRTMTKAEWDWLLGPATSPTPGTNCRTNALNLRGFAKIDGRMCGLVILPDNWVLPAGLTFRSGTNSMGGNINTYTYDQWALMEKYGAVYMPTGGFHIGGTNYEANVRGYYWTSTANGTSSYELRFFYTANGDNPIDPSCSFSIGANFSVRLVHTAR